jgi:hypothetical protein
MPIQYSINIRSSSTRRVYALSSPQAVDAGCGCKPECGDVVIGEVSEIGQHTKFEEPAGREIILQTGNVVAVVLGRRYSTREFHGRVPEKLVQGTEFDLLNVGGIAGEALSRNALAKAPTKLIYLGHAVDDQGKKMNTANFGIASNLGINTSFGTATNPGTNSNFGINTNFGINSQGECQEERSSLKIIAVFGSDMDCGKTLTAGRIIDILSTRGYRVGGGKLTGTSRMKDILRMKACGAHLVLDFLDVGYPSTYQCSLADLEYVFRVFKAYFSLSGCEFLVVEVADGVFERETEMILHSPAIMKDIALFAFAASDSVSAYGGIQYLQEHGLYPDFISGLIITNSLSMEELRSKREVQFLENSPESRDNFLRIINQQVKKQRESYDSRSAGLPLHP